MLEVYKGDSKRVDLTFRNDDGSVLNLSGCTIYYSAMRSYNDPNSSIISIINSGHDVAASGISHITLTTGDTYQCAGTYVAAFRLKDASNNVTTFDSDGLKILNAPPIV